MSNIVEGVSLREYTEEAASSLLVIDKTPGRTS
jgi:hypothetical protein